MEKRINKKIIIRGQDGRILSQLYCENGLSVKLNYYGESLAEADLYANDLYVGSIDCWKGDYQETFYFWDEQGTMIPCDKEGNPINGD